MQRAKTPEQSSSSNKKLSKYTTKKAAGSIVTIFVLIYFFTMISIVMGRSGLCSWHDSNATSCCYNTSSTCQNSLPFCPCTSSLSCEEYFEGLPPPTPYCPAVTNGAQPQTLYFIDSAAVTLSQSIRYLVRAISFRLSVVQLGNRTANISFGLDPIPLQPTLDYLELPAPALPREAHRAPGSLLCW